MKSISSLAMNLLERNSNQIKKLCAMYSVSELYTFGSIVNGNYTSQSDIDFLVSFSNVNLEDYADNYFDLKFALEDLLKRKIDLLEAKALKNPYLIQTINASKKEIYGH